MTPALAATGLLITLTVAVELTVDLIRTRDKDGR